MQSAAAAPARLLLLLPALAYVMSVAGPTALAAASSVGPSPVTVECQRLVSIGAGAMDHPGDFDPSLPLDDPSYGSAFANVSVHVLDNVTAPWTCPEGKRSACYDDLKGPRGRALLWVPDGAPPGGPSRLIYLHGGSWYYGSPATTNYAPFCARLARETSMPVLAIDYPLATVGNFTSILESVGAAAAFLSRWDAIPGAASGSGGGGGGGGERPSVFLAGDSSGGGTALSALVAATSPAGLPGAGAARLAGGVLFSPWIDLQCGTPTYWSQSYCLHGKGGKAYLGDVVFGKGGIAATSEEYQQNAMDYTGAAVPVTDPTANPMLAPPSWLARLPPVAVHTGAPELLQAEAALFAQRAAAAGALVELHLYDGMWHVFPMYSSGCGSKVAAATGARVVLADSAIASAAGFLKAIAAGGGAGGAPAQLPCTFLHYEYPRGTDSAAGGTCVKPAR